MTEQERENMRKLKKNRAVRLYSTQKRREVQE